MSIDVDSRIPLFPLDELTPGTARHAVVLGVDLVVVRPQSDPETVVVLYGRCQHRGALLADGEVREPHISCMLHGSTYRLCTGKNIYYPGADLTRFTAGVTGGQVWVEMAEVAEWARKNPRQFERDEYQGSFADHKGTPDEPHRDEIHQLASHGLSRVGHHGPVGAMGVPGPELPRWADLQLVTAQLARPPLLDDDPVGTDVVIGPAAAKPLRLEIPLLVSDMSFGALSAEAKVALAAGAEGAGTGICSGEGGMLEAEQQANSRYLYELASGRFGFSWEKVSRCQAFHFKGGQAAKTGTGGHLPGHKVTPEIAKVRGLQPGDSAISPGRFPDLTDPAAFRRVAEQAREATGGAPVGFKLSAQHIEDDLDAALAIGVDYVILDGRGGGTGAAPLIFRDHISVPTIPALARARAHLDAAGADHVSLIITGGLRTAPDFIKALALGADVIAVSNSAMQAIGCLAMRACETGRCPVGIATQDPALRSRLPVGEAAERLTRYLRSTVELMMVMARACGHSHLSRFSRDDLTTWKQEMAALSGVRFSGIG